MDDYAEAFNSLSEFIHESYTSQPYKKPIFLSEMEHFRQTAIPTELENIVNEIRGSVYNIICVESLNLSSFATKQFVCCRNLSTSKLQHRTILKMQGNI